MKTLRVGAAWLAVAAALGTAVWHVPGSVRTTDGIVDAIAGKTRLERELIPARQYDLELEPFLAAVELMPLDARFTVITGPGTYISHPQVLPKANNFAAYYLLPRRRTADLAEAEWVLSYGGDLNSLGLRYRRVVEVKPGIALAEIDR